MIRHTLQVLLVSSLVSCCAVTGSSSEAHVRGALDLLADVVDPSYELAMEGCKRRLFAAVERAESGEQSAAEAETKVHAIEVRCTSVRDSFEAIRLQHDRARELVGAGKLDEAQRALDALKREWSALQGGAE